MKQLHKVSIIVLISFSMLLTIGCSGSASPETKNVLKKTKITADYLFEHRIVTNEAKINKHIMTTPPFEVIDFDEQFLVYLIVQRVNIKGTKDNGPRYHIYIERTATDWLDYTQAYATHLGRFEIQSHFANIRQGRFFKSYTIALVEGQFQRLDNTPLTFVVSTKIGQQKQITIPTVYVEAYIKMANLPVFTKPE